MTQNSENTINIGVLTPPIGKSNLIPLSNFLNILLAQSKSLYLITGNEGYYAFRNDKRFYISGVNHKGENNNFLRMITFLLLQVRISIALIKVVRKCDILVFFLGGENMILPMFTAKIFRKKVYLVIAGSSVLTLYYDDLVNCLKLLTYINCLLSYKISLYSKKLISEWKLNQWENKIIIAQHSFMDSKNFSLIKKYNDRTNKIGFVGRLSEEKGIWDFMFSLEYIIKKQHDITFLIIGDGLLRKKIEEYTKKNELQSYIKFEGWVFHDELPQYLNQLRLLVIPSYTEGLPNVMLEAMACGTPVLATPVGAIPDIIKDGITGFIMGDNSPECIGKNVIRAINSHELAVIVANGRRVVEEIYTFDKAVEQWKEIFKKV